MRGLMGYPLVPTLRLVIERIHFHSYLLRVIWAQGRVNINVSRLT